MKFTRVASWPEQRRWRGDLSAGRRCSASSDRLDRIVRRTRARGLLLLPARYVFIEADEAPRAKTQRPHETAKRLEPKRNG